jgi:hypothetical protein
VTLQVADATPTTFKPAVFVAAVANALNITASQVAVTSVKVSAARAGAVQVTFVIKPSAAPGPVPASQVLIRVLLIRLFTTHVISPQWFLQLS